MDSDAYNNIVPLGNVAPPGHTFPTGHMYFGLPFVETGQPGGGIFGDGRVFPAQNVYAAADGRIASLALAEVVSTLSGSPESYKEYDLRLEVCDGIWIRYGHIGPLSDRLQALMDDVEANWCNSYSTGDFSVEHCEYSPSWNVEAGELIAYTSGRAAAFDFGATRPSSSGDGPPECPLNLYDDAQRAKFEQRIGTSRVHRTVAPLCGVVDLDVAGTAQGRWFKQLGGFPVEDENIALLFDNIEPEIPVFSIGNSVSGVRSDAYRFVPGGSGQVNRLFASVTPDAGIICYEGMTDRFDRAFDSLTFLIEMADDTTLRIEGVPATSCGNGPWSFSSNAATYLR